MIYGELIRKKTKEMATKENQMIKNIFKKDFFEENVKSKNQGIVFKPTSGNNAGYDFGMILKDENEDPIVILFEVKFSSKNAANTNCDSDLISKLKTINSLSFLWNKEKNDQEEGKEKSIFVKTENLYYIYFAQRKSPNKGINLSELRNQPKTVNDGDHKKDEGKGKGKGKGKLTIQKSTIQKDINSDDADNYPGNIILYDQDQMEEIFGETFYPVIQFL